MARIALTGGAYSARGLIAGAQACINLMPEKIPQASQEPAPVVHYPTPGLTALSVTNVNGCRCLYRARNGTLYGVYDTSVRVINPDWSQQHLGSIAAGSSRVSMADNGVLMVIVDGTTSGYVVTLANNTMEPIVADAFYGADYVEYQSTFFVFNRPGLPQFYVSDSNAVTFDPLYFANMAGGQDNIVGIIATRGALWMIGELHTEWWLTSGAPDFPFQAQPNASIDHGCCAKYSICKADNAVFWLSQDEQGRGIALMGRGYTAERISTHALEAEWRNYPTVADAWGYTRQQDGHTFYVVTFPAGNRTWAYDLATEQWHQWATGTVNNRHAIQVAVFAYGKMVGGDAGTGLYAIDPNAYDDNGTPIERVRAFPHLLDSGKRVNYVQFIADMECGTTTGAAPVIALDYSDDRGATFTGQQTATLGAAGATLTSVSFWRLGMARDRVFRLSWTAPVRTALQGAWVSTRLSAT